MKVNNLHNYLDYVSVYLESYQNSRAFSMDEHLLPRKLTQIIFFF